MIEERTTGFRTLHNFSDTSSWVPYTNSDGVFPLAGLTFSQGTLYGISQAGGISANGTVFSLKTDGSGFASLHSFTALSDIGQVGGTNSDGASPQGALVLSDNTLYGMAFFGGSSGNGTVFAAKTDGLGFATVYSFTTKARIPSTGYETNSDGANPTCSLTLSGDTLYGTGYFGGTSANGTIFSISLPSRPPQLSITSDGASIILTWATNAWNLTLQSSTNIFPTMWTTNLPAPVVVNGLNTVSVPISNTQQFFRLPVKLTPPMRF